jgi:hypothetical protein
MDTKKIVFIVKIVFWLSFIVFCFSDGLKDRLTWFIVVMACSFSVMQIFSSADPEIKKGRYYKLEKIIPHTNGSYFIVLSYDDNVETYNCEEIYASSNPQMGNKYLVEIENGTIFFTPV